MSNWVIVLTVWIIMQTIAKAAKQPYIARLKGSTIEKQVGSIIGTIMWGIIMIWMLYMCGIYD